MAEEVPLLVAELNDPNFLAVFMREAKLSLSPVDEGGGCCLACWRHLARRFLNQTLKWFGEIIVSFFYRIIRLLDIPVL